MDGRGRGRETWPLTAALAVASVLALHQVAYLLAHPDPLARAAAGRGHGYLGPVTEVILPLALAVAAWLVACHACRRVAATLPCSRDLGLAIAGLFVVQETVERLVHGDGPGAVIAEPAVWLGLALVPLAARATGTVLGLGGRLAERLEGAVPRLSPPVLAWPLAPAPVPGLPRGRVPLVRARGPPSLSLSSH